MEKPTTIIYGNQYNFGDINGGTLNLGNNPKKERKFGVTIPKKLIPRRDMLDRLDAEFVNDNCVVVSGIGGSGKTSLAYLYAKEKEFNNIIWITVNGKIEDVFVDRIAGLLLSNEDYEKFSKIEDKQTKLDIIKNELSNIAGNNLLVLDINSNDDKTKQEIESDLYNYLPANYWKTLVLTRTKAINTKRFITVDMTQMTEDEAVELFKGNYRGYIQFSDVQLADIAKELLYHPLLIEQTAIYFTDGFENSAEEIIAKIKENKVSNERTQESLHGLAAEGKEEQKIYTYLINLCNIKTLSDEEKNFLAVYVTWPTEPINKETIDTLMPGYDATLKKLNKKGILSYNGNQFVIHSLIADVLREQIEIEKHDYTEYLEHIENFLLDDKLLFILQKYSVYLYYSFIQYGICIDIDMFRFYLDKIYEINDPVLYRLLDNPNYTLALKKIRTNANPMQLADLYNAMAGIEERNSNYDNAKKYYEKALEILSGQEDSIDILEAKARYLNSIAVLCNAKNDLESAIIFYEQTLDVLHKIPDSQESISTILIGMAICESQLFHFKQARNHYYESLDIMYKLPNCNLPHNLYKIAQILSNLAVIEHKIGNDNNVKALFEKALTIRNKLHQFANNKDELATLLNNYALFQADCGDNDSAITNYQDALAIRKELFLSPRNIMECIILCNNLANLEAKLGDFGSAKKHYGEALNFAHQIDNEKYIKIIENLLSRLPS